MPFWAVERRRQLFVGSLLFLGGLFLVAGVMVGPVDNPLETLGALQILIVSVACYTYSLVRS